MNNRFLQYLYFPVILLFPLIVLISYLNNDYDLKYLYVLSFVFLLIFLFVFYFDSRSLLFLSNNIIILLLIFTFSHTFLWFTIFPIIFNLEYNYLIVTAVLFVLMIIYSFLKPNKDRLKAQISVVDKIILFGMLTSFSISVLVINNKEFTTSAGFSKNIIQFSSLYFFYYFFPLFLLKSKQNLNYFIITVYIIGLLSSSVGIFTVFAQSFNTVNEYPGASVSFFTHPNANAFLYSYTIPCAFYLLINYKEKIKILTKTGIIFSVIMTLVNQALTFSRSGIIAVLIGISIFIYYYYKKVFLIFLILSPILVYILFNITTSEKGASTVVGRVGLLATGVEMILNNKTAMFWGYGVDNNFKQFEETKSSLLFLETNNNPHNSVLFLILAFGLTPTFFVLIFIIKRMFELLINYLNGKLNLISVLTFSITLSVLIQSLFEDYVLFPQYYMYHLFLVFLGLLFLTNFEYKSFQSILKDVDK